MKLIFDTRADAESFVADKEWQIKNFGKELYADGGTTVVEEFGSTNFRNQYDDWEMVVISKGLEKDGGQYLKDRYLVSAKDIEEAKKIATELWEKEMGNSDFHIVKVMSDELYRLKYMDVYDVDEYADGGMANDGSMSKIERMRKIKNRQENEKISKIERMRLVKNKIESKSKKQNV